MKRPTSRRDFLELSALGRSCECLPLLLKLTGIGRRSHRLPITFGLPL